MNDFDYIFQKNIFQLTSIAIKLDKVLVKKIPKYSSNLMNIHFCNL